MQVFKNVLFVSAPSLVHRWLKISVRRKLGKDFWGLISFGIRVRTSCQIVFFSAWITLGLGLHHNFQLEVACWDGLDPTKLANEVIRFGVESRPRRAAPYRATVPGRAGPATGDGATAAGFAKLGAAHRTFGKTWFRQGTHCRRVDNV